MKTMTFASFVLLVGLASGQAPSPQTAKPKPTSSAGGRGSQFLSGSSSGSGTMRGFSTTVKSGLEESIDIALVNNPDLRVAVAKVREAEAAMSRTRLQVLQKVVAAYQSIDDARVTTSHAERRLSELKQVPKVVSEEVMRQAEIAVSRAKAAQAAAQAELDYLLGKVPVKATSSKLSDFDKRGRTPTPAEALYEYILHGQDSYRTAPMVSEAVRGPSADRLRKTLDRKVTMKFSDTPAKEVLAQLRKETTGLHIQASDKHTDWNEKVTATLDNVPLSAALQLLEDVLGEHRIVVRDYGLYIAPKAMVPSGATLLADFLRDGARATKADLTPPPAK